MVLKPYPEKVRAEIYLVSLCQELIKGRSMSTSLAHKWKGDYLTNVPFSFSILAHLYNHLISIFRLFHFFFILKVNENPKASLYFNIASDLKRASNAKRTLFSSFVHKVGISSKSICCRLEISNVFCFVCQFV